MGSDCHPIFTPARQQACTAGSAPGLANTARVTNQEHGQAHRSGHGHCGQRQKCGALKKWFAHHCLPEGRLGIDEVRRPRSTRANECPPFRTGLQTSGRGSFVVHHGRLALTVKSAPLNQVAVLSPAPFGLSPAGSQCAWAQLAAMMPTLRRLFIGAKPGSTMASAASTPLA